MTRDVTPTLRLVTGGAGDGVLHLPRLVTGGVGDGGVVTYPEAGDGSEHQVGDGLCHAETSTGLWVQQRLNGLLTDSSGCSHLLTDDDRAL